MLVVYKWTLCIKTDEMFEWLKVKLGPSFVVSINSLFILLRICTSYSTYTCCTDYVNTRGFMNADMIDRPGQPVPAVFLVLLSHLRLGLVSAWKPPWMWWIFFNLSLPVAALWSINLSHKNKSCSCSRSKSWNSYKTIIFFIFLFLIDT